MLAMLVVTFVTCEVTGQVTYFLWVCAMFFTMCGYLTMLPTMIFQLYGSYFFNVNIGLYDMNSVSLGGDMSVRVKLFACLCMLVCLFVCVYLCMFVCVCLFACKKSRQHGQCNLTRGCTDSCMCSRFQIEIKLVITPSHIILTPDRPVLAGTLSGQALDKVVTCMSRLWRTGNSVRPSLSPSSRLTTLRESSGSSYLYPKENPARRLALWGHCHSWFAGARMISLET